MAGSRAALAEWGIEPLGPDHDRSSFDCGEAALNAIAAHSMPPEIRRKIPKYPVPVARLGRLAVDLAVEGRGLGSTLLRDALLRAARIAATEMGIVAVVVDAKNEAAKEFYERYGFVPFADSPLSLFILTATVLAAMGTEWAGRATARG